MTICKEYAPIPGSTMGEGDRRWRQVGAGTGDGTRQAGWRTFARKPNEPETPVSFNSLAFECRLETRHIPRWGALQSQIAGHAGAETKRTQQFIGFQSVSFLSAGSNEAPSRNGRRRAGLQNTRARDNRTNPRVRDTSST